MPAPADRLALLLEAYGDSYRSAAELCGLDHTTLIRVRQGEIVSPVTLQRIAEGYGVPVSWVQGEKDVRIDFELHVLRQPTEARIELMWSQGERVAFAIRFLADYDPEAFSPDRLAARLDVDQAALEGLMTGVLPDADRIASKLSPVGVPAAWLETGVLDETDAEDFLPNLVQQALQNLAEAVGAPSSETALQRIAAYLA